MSIKIQAIIKYAISFALGGALLWYVYRDTNFNQLINDLKDASLGWVFISYGFAMFSHLVRAYRWNLLMEPVNLNPSIQKSFLALMVGYLANTFLPRMGEVSRCAVLNRTDGIPVNKSFGTVITERVFDLLSLLFISSITLIIEADRLGGFLYDIIHEKFGKTNLSITIIAGLLGALFFSIFIIRAVKRPGKRLGASKFYLSFKSFLRGLFEGILSFRNLKKKKEFIISTIIIWVCYYAMAYVVFFALPVTSHLGMTAGLAVLVLGGFGMAAPSPGGIGSYHWIIMKGMVLYGLSEDEGKVYATLMHSSQLIMLVGVGLVCLLASVLLARKTSLLKVKPTHENI